ncbi:LOB domain-containing protein 29 [Linum perenne]
MAGSGSPCGACKFLRRRCARGCVFAPYFSNEQGATNFAAIHKVFGASNVAKLLAHLPLDHRCEAAMTISYEAQARVHNPVYGCVSHIFALQHQVVNLQAQLDSLKEQAGHTFANDTIENPTDDHRHSGNDNHNPMQDMKSWLDQYQSGAPLHNSINSNMVPESYDVGGHSFERFEDVSNSVSSSMHIREEHSSKQYWDSSAYNYHNLHHQQGADDLHSVAFGYVQHS